METALFALFSIVAIGSCLLVILKKNPLISALFLVLAFICFAGFYVLLQAQFVAVLQLIIYAGAIMVLFLFVIMLLDLGVKQARIFNLFFQKFFGVLLALGFLLFIVSMYGGELILGRKGDFPAARVAEAGNAETFAAVLFTDYLLPFEIISILLLIAVIGAVVLTRKKI
jgi:NADH-quinone oxidoreductase subunit J